jgi:two-component system, LytTR family, response regulator
MIKAVIIDDEPMSIENLKNMLLLHSNELEIIGETLDPDEGIDLINTLSPDVVFLDIEMPMISGFELYKKLAHPRPDVVFVTAYNNFAIDAFKINAMDYILKPIDMDRLDKTISRIIKKFSQNKNKLDLSIIIDKLENGQNTKLAIHTLESIEFISIQDIIYLSSSGSYTTFHIGTRKITSTKRLGEYEKLLNPNLFIRIHHQSIVNISYISRYLKGRGGEILLKNGVKLEVAQRKKEDLLDILNV